MATGLASWAVVAMTPLVATVALTGRPSDPGGAGGRRHAVAVSTTGPGPVARRHAAPQPAARLAVRPRVARRPAADPQVLLGRYLVLSHACSACHGGEQDPNDPGWLAGEPSPDREFLIGPCSDKPDAQPCFHTHARNLTPDQETGLARFTARQIFNALRYGLRPEDTPDVTITSTTPGKGNFPLHPHYLAPPMPWPSWRFMHDQDLWAIAAYLKRGIKPVSHKVPESEGPPDFWASGYAGAIPQLKLAPYPAPPFPAANERSPEHTVSAH